MFEALEQAFAARGPITYAEFMQLALYSPQGYYPSRVPGPGSDFATSPSLSPVFGALVAAEFARVWEKMGRPGRFVVCEAGAGSAALARHALGAAEGEFAHCLQWCIVERFEPIRRIQQQALQGAPVAWFDGLEDVGPFTGVVLANEVLDNMPVRVVELTGEGPVEVRVALGPHGPEEVRAPVTDPRLLDESKRAAAFLEPGDRFEFRPALQRWCRQAAGALQAGRLLVIDYGDPEPEIWTNHPAGTIVTYRDEQLGLNPLADPGKYDITAHVNFSALSRAAQEAGFGAFRLESQREWLNGLGAPRVFKDIKDAGAEASAIGNHGEGLRLLAELGRAAALTARGGLGDLTVFSAEKLAALPPGERAG